MSTDNMTARTGGQAQRDRVGAPEPSPSAGWRETAMVMRVARLADAVERQNERRADDGRGVEQ